MPNKPMATRANHAQVQLHISRQRALGERLIGDHDKPRRIDLAATLIVLGAIVIGSFAGWW